MAESEARDWVLVWVEDLHRRAGSKRFWEEEQERIDLGTCCLFDSVLQPLGSTTYIPTVTVAESNKQHVPKSIRSCSSSQKRLLPARRCKSSTQTNTQSLASDSAIGLHLLQNPTCAQHYDDSRFSILARGRSPFHLSALEATFIKTSNPALCRQKEFVYSLKIVH